jgi:hypothetical protein
MSVRRQLSGARGTLAARAPAAVRTVQPPSARSTPVTSVRISTGA